MIALLFSLLMLGPASQPASQPVDEDLLKDMDFLEFLLMDEEAPWWMD